MQDWIENFTTLLRSPWAIFGLVGQLLFFSRWIVQWISSERKKESHVPLVFWYLSLIGGFILLVYSFYRHDPVFMLGQTVGIANYWRNIVLIRSKMNHSAPLG